MIKKRFVILILTAVLVIGCKIKVVNDKEIGLDEHNFSEKNFLLDFEELIFLDFEMILGNLYLTTNNDSILKYDIYTAEGVAFEFYTSTDSIIKKIDFKELHDKDFENTDRRSWYFVDVCQQKIRNIKIVNSGWGEIDLEVTGEQLNKIFVRQTGGRIRLLLDDSLADGTHIEVETATAAIDIEVLANVNVETNIKKGLARISAQGFEQVSDERYLSLGYDDELPSIRIDITCAFGNIKLYKNQTTK